MLDIAATQLPTGGAYHQYQPLTKRGNDDVGCDFNDDPLWLILGVAAYIKETGDWSHPRRAGAVRQRARQREAAATSTSQRSLQYTLDRLGPHGLPLIGRADWNDCLNLNCFSETPGESFQTTTNKDGSVAESVFIGGPVRVWRPRTWRRLPGCGAIGRGRQFGRGRESMTGRSRRRAGTASGSVRAYDDFGRPVGSSECKEGQIFIEPQGMCVMAGIGLENGMAARALDSRPRATGDAARHRARQPAYTGYHLELGEISSYPPGYKENGGDLLPHQPLGDDRRDDSWATAKAPSTTTCASTRRRARRSREVHRCEPYVYAQMIAGKDAAAHGEAKNSWLTGTAAWNFVAISQWILGIRAEHDGLRIDPVIPADWAGFTVTRRFRGATYRITVAKAAGVTGRVASLTVDGRPVEGSLAPLPSKPGQTIEVVARY